MSGLAAKWLGRLTRHSEVGVPERVIGLVMVAEGAQWHTAEVKLSTEIVADKAGYSAADVEMAVSRLQELGFLQRVPRNDRGRPVYVLLAPAPADGGDPYGARYERP